MRKKQDSMQIPEHLAKKCVIRDQKTEYPLIVLPHIVFFPDNILPLSALSGLKEKDLKKAQKGLLKFGVVSRLNQPEDTNEVLAGYGTEATVTALIKLPNGELGAIIRGGARFILQKAVKNPHGYTGTITFAEDLPFEASPSLNAESKALKALIVKVLKYQPGISQEAAAQLLTQDDPIVLSHLIIPHLSIPQKVKISLLGSFDFQARLKRVIKILGKELKLLQISSKIQDKVKDGVHDNLKRNFLREQMQVIKKELGDMGSTEGDEVLTLKKQLVEKNLPEAVMESAAKELDRLSGIHPGSPEYTVSLTWLNWLKDLPWPDPDKPESELQNSFHKASEILDTYHSGLQKVKERILEFIAVVQHKGQVSGQILLLSGPPGVGKTSLGKSVAEALGRPYVRVSLGGVKDEAEIRGHRRTYIGAMPGKIIQALKQAESDRPVILLDEIDKLGRDGMQDLSSALLEVLDPEQNKNFTDHYLSVPYDLSKVLFIATANSAYQMSAPLLDRMEHIELQGYTETEKVEIARNHLVPRQRTELSLSPEQYSIEDSAILQIVRQYTRESGVRQLNRQLGKIGRGLVRKLLAQSAANEDSTPPGLTTVTDGQLKELLGNPVWTDDLNHLSLPAGVSVGLAYTSVGGDILYIESRKTKVPGGKSELKLTGSLGKVMQESAHAVFSFLLSNPDLPGIDQDEILNSQVHIHLPAGATPKDGPSAGIALLCAMTSLFTGRPLREGLAMTGEISLRGQVLPVGGIREKLLAAHRYGRKTIMLPKANWRDLEDLPLEILQDLTLYPVDSMTDVLKISGAIAVQNESVIPKPEAFLPGKELTQGASSLPEHQTVGAYNTTGRPES